MTNTTKFKKGDSAVLVTTYTSALGHKSRATGWQWTHDPVLSCQLLTIRSFGKKQGTAVNTNDENVRHHLYPADVEWIGREDAYVIENGKRIDPTPLDRTHAHGRGLFHAADKDRAIAVARDCLRHEIESYLRRAINHPGHCTHIADEIARAKELASRKAWETAKVIDPDTDWPTRRDMLEGK